MEPTAPPEPEKSKASKVADNLQFFFGFLIVFTGLQFAMRPVSTTAQLIFRLAMLSIGIAGSIGVLAWRLASRR